MSRVWEWFKVHSHAVLATAAVLEGSHLLGRDGSQILSTISSMFSVFSGT